MDIRINPIGIDPTHIPLFRKLATIALKKQVPDVEIGILLVRVGGMDAWPQLHKLGEMDAAMRAPGFDATKNQSVVLSFLDLAVTMQEKIILAWIAHHEGWPD